MRTSLGVVLALAVMGGLPEMAPYQPIAWTGGLPADYSPPALVYRSLPDISGSIPPGPMPARVVTIVEVDEAGRGRVVGSSGDWRFVDASEESALMSTYRPATVGGRPIVALLQVAFTYGDHSVRMEVVP